VGDLENAPNMKHEPRPGDGVPVPRHPATDQDTTGASAAARSPLKMPEVHHMLPAAALRVPPEPPASTTD